MVSLWHLSRHNFGFHPLLARKITVAAIEVQSRAAGTHTPPRCDLSYFLRKLSRAFLADLIRTCCHLALISISKRTRSM
jgi:hypothetical protein